MQIVEYKYITPTIDRGEYIAIPELDRKDTTVNQFISITELKIPTNKPTGIILIEGFSIAQSESGIKPSKSEENVVTVKTGSSYALHKWIGQTTNPDNVVYATIVSSTCASGIEAIYVADKLLNKGVCEEVVIIGSERTTEDTISLFKELRIPVVCGDGFVYMKLAKGDYVNTITKPRWLYSYNKNPFVFRKQTLNNLIPNSPVDYIKLHGTGTKANDLAESDLEKIALPLKYKCIIGHTQGISSLIETCLVLSDKSIFGNILVVANGFSGFYGSFILNKR